MIVRPMSRLLNSSTARTVLAVGAVALVAVMFSFPVDARPKPSPRQRCMERCQIGDHYCFLLCVIDTDPTPRRAATARRNPNPTPVHSGGSRH